MLTNITHVKKDRDHNVIEVGAVLNGHTLWRATEREAVQRHRAGCRYYVTPETGGHAIMVDVDPGDLYLEPRLRTVADKLFDRKLARLPEFPC